MFIIALYTYPYAKNKFLMYLALGYFWVASLDLFHALIYKGIAIFPFADANYSTQFWLASRFLEALILLTAPFIFKRPLNTGYAFATFGSISGIFFILIMNNLLPITFIEGKGLTDFKIHSEYLICFILSLALVNLYIHRDQLKAGIYPFLLASTVLTICAELAFTFYIDVYGLSNLVGHVLKLFSFWLIFYSIVRHNLRAPYEELRKTSSLLRALRDGIPDLIFYKDKRGVYLGCNQAFCDFVGKEKEADVIGITDYDMFDQDLASFFRNKDTIMLKANNSKRNDEEAAYPSGKKVLLDTLKTPFRDTEGNIIGLIGISRDITERKRLENENLSQIHHLESLQKVSDAINSSLATNDTLNNTLEQVRKIFQSDRAWLLYPCDPHADTWEIPVESTLPEYRSSHTSKQKFPMSPDMKKIILDALNSPEPVVYCPMPSIDKGMSQFAVKSQMLLAIKPKFGEAWLLGLQQCSHERQWSSEETILFHSIGARISDLLSATYLNRDLKKLSQAVQEAGESILITDLDAIIEYVNPAFTEITGYLPEEALGKTPAILKSSAQDPSFYKELWDTITHGGIWHGTLIDRRKDGVFYPALTSISPIRDDENKITHFVSIQQDMSEHQKLEEKFLQAQKMEAVGTLVGGIAHDFNNMLAAIQGNVYLSKKKLENQPEIRDKLDSIEELGLRAADMVRQLLTFSRKGRVDMAPLSFTAFIKEGHKLAKTAIPENIELVCNPSQEALTIKGDGTQLQQVLMNLLNNARDAVSEVREPKISCSLKSFAATPTFIKEHPETNATQFALLTVQDNGSGISKDCLDKIFDPFFTTKGVGEGTGLGLAMVYGAIQSHNGVIEAKSEPNVGTTFNVYLPLMEKMPEDSASETEVIITEGQGETILLVDDEESMRNTTGEVLESLGYKVLQAEDGEKALEIFKNNKNIIDMVLTDIVMPRMGGIALAKAIRQCNHTVPIIFATGYNKEHAIASETKIDKSAFVEKPYSFQDLSQLIRSLISPN